MRVIVIDDHPLLVTGLRQTLEVHFPEVQVQEAPTAREGLAWIRRESWDLALLDLDLPDRPGLDLLQDIRLAAPDLPVLILSAQAEDEFGPRALKAGARGFISKTGPPGELTEAVRKVVAGRRHVSPALAEKLAAGLDDGEDGAPHERLSAREFQVLTMLGSGKGVTEIAKELSLSAKTVSTYRARVLEKMELGSNLELMRYVLRNRLGS